MNQTIRNGLMAESSHASGAQRTTLKSALKVIKPFWVSEEKWQAGRLLGTRLGLDVLQTYLLVGLNEWSGNFGTALQTKNWEGFVHGLTGYDQFPMYAGSLIAVAVASWYVTQSLDLRWGKWLTENTLDKFMDHKAYNRLPSHYRKNDNPDQRIDEDLRAFASSTLSLSLGFVKTAMRLGSFTPILWGLAGDVTFTIADAPITIPHFMFWAALGYAAAGSVATYHIGKKLTPLNQAQQKLRADYRYALARQRDNTDSISAYGGEQIEKGMLKSRFNRSIDNMWNILGKTKQVMIFQNFYDQFANIFPYVISAPLYFFGGGDYGTLMRTTNAFAHVQDGMSYFINSFTGWADWLATANRTTSFLDSIEKSNNDVANRDYHGIVRETGNAAALVVDDISVDTPAPENRNLLEHINLEMKPGQRIHIRGASGSGKSTLFKALNGEWEEGRGRVFLPDGAKLMRVPQKSYMPLLTLSGIVTYPSASKAFSAAAVRDALASVKMEHLASDLDDESKKGDYWTQRLSGGEQQRLTIARLLLHKPDFILLDENTSGLDEAAEADICAMLKDCFPNAGVAHISHKPSIVGFHTHRADIAHKTMMVMPLP